MNRTKYLKTLLVAYMGLDLVFFLQWLHDESPELAADLNAWYKVYIDRNIDWPDGIDDDDDDDQYHDAVDVPEITVDMSKCNPFKGM